LIEKGKSDIFSSGISGIRTALSFVMRNFGYQNGGFVGSEVTALAVRSVRFAALTVVLAGCVVCAEQPTLAQPESESVSETVPAADVVAVDAAASDDASSVKGAQKPADAKAAPPAKKTVTLTLPPEYKSRDTNGDGQIGLYEWGRKDIAKFRSLDANRDGFLTPSELVASSRPQLKRSAGTTFLPSGKGAITPAGARVVANSVELSSDMKSRAAKTFSDLDKNKDGMLTSEEVMSSRFMGRKLKAAGVEVKEPLSADAFAELFAKHAAS
jgi:hypothetical protein